MAAISSAKSGGRGDIAPPPSPRAFITGSPVAASLILHLGIAVVALWAALSREEASPSAGHPNALTVEIVQMPSKRPNTNTNTNSTAPKSPPARQEAVAAAKPYLRARAPQKASHEAPLPDAAAHKAAVNKATTFTPASAMENAEARSRADGGSLEPNGSVGANETRTTEDEIPLLTNARYRVPPTPPRYPKRARDLNQEGEVLIRVRLSRSGEAEEVLIWKSSGFVLLDNSAQAAVRRWDFEPARRNGQPITAWVQIPVRFSLH